MKQRNQYLLDCFEAAFDEIMPAEFRDFILSGKIDEIKDREILHPTSGETFKMNFIKDAGFRMDGMFDQSTRLMMEDKLDINTPIAFADLELNPKPNGYKYCLAFVKKDLKKTNKNNFRVHLIKFKGYDKSMKCESSVVGESFNEFLLKSHGQAIL